MIVLINVKLTPHRLTGYNRGIYRNSDRVDVFKYMMSSYAVFEPLVSKYLLYLDIEGCWEGRKQEIEDYVRKEIPSDKLELVWRRNTTVEDWRRFCIEKLDTSDDKILWFSGNDDHIFMDYDLTCLYYGIKGLEQSNNPHSAMFYSHWFETIRVAAKMGAKLDPTGQFVSFPWAIHDSIRLMRKELWKHYWFDHDFRHANGGLWRVDSIKDWTGDNIMCNIQVPTRELCRHFDGHSHVSGELFDYGPPLEIPNGFFEKKMLIRYGWPDNYQEEKYVNINPLKRHLKNSDIVNCTDYRLTLDRLPLFWTSRINEYVKYRHIDEVAAEKSHDEYFLKGTRLGFSAYCMGFPPSDCPPEEWFVKQLKTKK